MTDPAWPQGSFLGGKAGEHVWFLEWIHLEIHFNWDSKALPRLIRFEAAPNPCPSSFHHRPRAGRSSPAVRSATSQWLLKVPPCRTTTTCLGR